MKEISQLKKKKERAQLTWHTLLLHLLKTEVTRVKAVNKGTKGQSVGPGRAEIVNLDIWVARRNVRTPCQQGSLSSELSSSSSASSSRGSERGGLGSEPMRANKY